MSLRTQAEADLASTLEAPGDFGFPFTLTAPDGTTSPDLLGQTGDIGTLIDPDTGLAVSGRHAHLTVRISSLVAAGFTDLPRGIADLTSDPWVVTFDDLAANTQLWKVEQSMPDRTLGVVAMVLEFWKAAP